MSWFHTGEFYSLACAVLWAFAVILFRRGGEHVPPVALNLFKDVVGLALFLVTLLLLGIPLVPAEVPLSDWLVLLLSGAVGVGLADSLFFASLNRLGAGRSAIVDCLYAPLVVLCSAVYLDEPAGWTVLLAMVLMSCAILIGTWEPGRGAGATPSRSVRAGVAMGALSMVFMASAIVAAKPVLDRTDPWWAAAVRLAGGVAVLATQGAFPSNRAGVAAAFKPGRLWRITVPSAVIGAYLAMIVWIAGMKYTYTTIASVLNQSSSVFVLFLAAVLLRERLTARKVVAIAMGFAAGVLVSAGG
jgi:drug/metabolite transporter (DMT)-like permease